MKGWCQLALKVFLYTCGAAIGGLCVAFGIGLLTAAPASAVTAGGLPGAATAGGVPRRRDVRGMRKVQPRDHGDALTCV
jgi:hypothetical protein